MTAKQQIKFEQHATETKQGQAAMSFFSHVELAPQDPILGLTEQFSSDKRPDKVNLGVGMYFDEAGQVPLLQCVREAEKQMLTHTHARRYLPIDGLTAYDHAMRQLAFGADSRAVQDQRIATVQSLGGTGALKIAADFLRRVMPQARVYISNPSWANHKALFTQAGFEVQSYRYADNKAHQVDESGMLADLQSAPEGSILVLHACCHNPTGYDLSSGQWHKILQIVRQRQLMPVLDMAYQGFGQGLQEDAQAVRLFADSGLDAFVATSCSKNFSLYGERVGALSVVCQSAQEKERILSQLKIMIRTNYSNPPTYGASLVNTILQDAQLRQQWHEELSGMRQRIQQMRTQLVQGLSAAGVDMSFIARQQGMFSYTGLSKDQMIRLRDEHGIYGTLSGRICVAGLNPSNIGHVCQAMAEVVKNA